MFMDWTSDSECSDGSQCAPPQQANVGDIDSMDEMTIEEIQNHPDVVNLRCFLEWWSENRHRIELATEEEGKNTSDDPNLVRLAKLEQLRGLYFEHKRQQESENAQQHGLSVPMNDALEPVPEYNLQDDEQLKLASPTPQDKPSGSAESRSYDWQGGPSEEDDKRVDEDIPSNEIIESSQTYEFELPLWNDEIASPDNDEYDEVPTSESYEIELSIH